MIQKSIQCWSSQMLASIIDDSIATHTISSPTRIADIHHTPTTILDLDSCTSEIIPTPLPWPVEATIKKHYSATVLVLQALAAAMKVRYHSSSESANDTFVPVDSTIAPVFLANASEDAFPFLPFPLLFPLPSLPLPLPPPPPLPPPLPAPPPAVQAATTGGAMHFT